ncbi:hypothetical protein L798_08208 [Zootermopsis nevadensis]|uniref:Uncharacterized protein n=1 Tax=Zootermopsis nevadensis TaxID=136037 RepID=A0A067R6C3_ZOONE|nr:hypothetical protein L798_08208 [Zootermopsis nevadensis]
MSLNGADVALVGPLRRFVLYLSANTGRGECVPEEVDTASGVAAVVLVTLVLLVVPNRDL